MSRCAWLLSAVASGRHLPLKTVVDDVFVCGCEACVSKGLEALHGRVYGGLK